MRSIFFIVIALFFTVTLSAQDLKNYSFTHYTTTTGLSSEHVYATAQDEDGYIWIGGVDGLQRFDGVRYKSFKHNENDSTSIPQNEVLQIEFDKYKRMWLCLADGSLGYFNTKTFKFIKVTVTPKDEKDLRVPKRLIVTDYGIFYILLDRELLTYDETKRGFSYEYNIFKQNDDWIISDFIKQPGTDKYWIGIKNIGLAIYNKTTGKLSYKGNNIEKEPAIDLFDNDHYPNTMLFDKSGRVWWWWSPLLGTPQVYCFDLKTNIRNKYDLTKSVGKYHEIYNIIELNDGSVWIYGLSVFAKFLENEKRFAVVHNGYFNESSIAYETITSLFSDREHNIWAGTSNNGLFRFNPSSEHFTSVLHNSRTTNQLGSGYPECFIKTKWGSILVGTWKDGLYEYDNNLNPIPLNITGLNPKYGRSTLDMCLSADSNTLWIAAKPGLYAIDQNKRSSTFYNPPIIEEKITTQVIEDKSGNLWLGMFNFGMFAWKVGDGKKLDNKNIQRFDAIPNYEGVNKMIIDRFGILWIATKHSGAFAVDTKTEKVLRHFTGSNAHELTLSSDGVSSIVDYNDSIVVLTTVDRILLYNRKTNKITASGAPGKLAGAITAVEKDKVGYLWITTISGLYRISLEKDLYTRFGREDGLQNDNFVLAASRLLPDGRLLFGCSNQFVAFDPAKIQKNLISNQKVTITDFEVMNKPLSVDSLLHLKEINLNYEQNSLNIWFSSLTYNNYAIIQYKLEGLDAKWMNASKDLHAVYNYLPPGDYTLLFRTIDGDGNITNNDQEILIIINPPFYRTWLFYSILVLTIGGILFWLDKQRMKRKEAVEKMRADIAGNLHLDVNTALSNINILSEMAKMKADSEPQKSKEFIEQIHAKSHNMIIAMDDMLWSISPENDSMEKTIERMQEYIDALNNRHQANIEMLVDNTVKLLKLDMQFRHEAFLLFKECIKGLINACAFNCKIHVVLEKPVLLFSIQFSHRKCDLQQLNNLLQRRDMEKRLNAIKAKLNIEMHKADAVFEIRMPVG